LSGTANIGENRCNIAFIAKGGEGAERKRDDELGGGGAHGEKVGPLKEAIGGILGKGGDREVPSGINA